MVETLMNDQLGHSALGVISLAADDGCEHSRREFAAIWQEVRGGGQWQAHAYEPADPNGGRPVPFLGHWFPVAFAVARNPGAGHRGSQTPSPNTQGEHAPSPEVGASRFACVSPLLWLSTVAGRPSAKAALGIPSTCGSGTVGQRRPSEFPRNSRGECQSRKMGRGCMPRPKMTAA